MRFESLQFRGFGPYAEIQAIDFACLHAQGLFSVTGPTGAGKTTIFDALTFALYGSVPGARNDATTSVRSDHVPPTVKTEVILEFSTGPDRWRVTRSPEYERPKARGTGTTVQKATVTLHRLSADGWEPVSGTKQEVDGRLVELVGLTRHQFERVALLPQGEFRRLLHAKSKDRRLLFRTLFGTEAIDRAVGALRDQARAAADVARTQAVLVDEDRRQAEMLSAELEAVLTNHAGEKVVMLPSDEAGYPEGVIAQLRDQDRQLRRLVLPALDSAERTCRLESAAAASARDRAVEWQAAIERRRVLIDELADLDGALVEAEQGAARAELARRARPVADIEAVCQEATERHAQAQATAQATRQSLATTAAAAGESVDLEHLGPWRDRLQRRRHEVSDLCSVADDLGAERKRRAAQHLVLDDSTDRIDAAERARAEAEAEQAALRTVVEQADAAAARRAVVETELAAAQRHLADARIRDEARQALAGATAMAASVEEKIAVCERAIDVLADERTARLSVAAELADRRTALAEAERRHRDAQRRQALDRQIHETARQVATIGLRVADLSQRFAAGVAPRLAAHLVDGDPCPVCGSCEHPFPAEADGTELVQESELREVTEEHRQATAALAGLRASRQELALPVACSLDSAVAERQRASDDVTASEEAVARIAEIERSLDEERNRLDEFRIERVQLTSAIDAQARRLADATGAAGASDVLTVASRVDTLEAERSGLAALADQASDARSAVERLNDTITRSERAVAHAREQRAATLASLEEIDRAVATLTGRLAPLDGRDPGDVLEELDDLLGALDAVATADRDVEAADRDVARLEAERDRLLAQSGIPSVAEALAGALPPDEVDRLQCAYDDLASRITATTAALAQLDHLDLPDELPDVAALSEAADAAESAARQAAETRLKVAELSQRADQLATRLHQRITSQAEAQAAADRAERVAGLCEGKGPARIGLEAFVLREHFADVVHFANLRLRSISAGRYHLSLAGEALDGRNEWGLDFTISDAHTGAERDVRSLSGGETFYTSLALALGLSDVLSNRGSTAINSVFIDEGFGSLDPEVIELTIDVLHQLHGDGVTVGVITHVEAVRVALPAGLVVERRAGGDSMVTQRVA